MRADIFFNTFPRPQTPTKGQAVEVAAAVALRALRREIAPPAPAAVSLRSALDEQIAHKLA